MIVIDTNIWVDHLRSPDAALCALLDAENAPMHPYVLGEIALGNLHDRVGVLSRLATLRQVPVADHASVLMLIEKERLFGTGIGYVDAHLLAATLATRKGWLWTRDRRLHAQPKLIGAAYAV